MRSLYHGRRGHGGWRLTGIVAMNYISDNQAGAHPAVLAAVADASAGMSAGYGEDAMTAAAEAAVRDIFETDCAVFFVTTGTAANALALSAMCPPWGAIYCHEGAHIQNDENTAVELFTGGARMAGMPGESGKPDLAAMREHMKTATVHGVHNARPGAISLSNVSESGTIYTPEEIQGYRQLADDFEVGITHRRRALCQRRGRLGGKPGCADLAGRSGLSELRFDEERRYRDRGCRDL